MSSTSAPTPPTIYSLAHTLHAQLSSTINAANQSQASPSSSPTTHLHHPLNPTSLPSTLATFSTLRQACTSFSSSILSPSVNDHRQATEKLLSLLRETSASQASIILSNNAIQSFATTQAQREAAAPVLSWNLLEGFKGSRGERTLAIVEGISEALGFLSYKETSQVMGDGGEVGEIATLSLGADVMVVDIEVVLSSGVVRRVKFSYVRDGQQKEDEEVARIIMGTLGGVERVLDVDGEEKAEKGLRRFRNSLKELKLLDEASKDGGGDAFEAVKKMAGAIHDILEAEFISASSTFAAASHGFTPASSQNPYSTTIIFDASASLQLSPESDNLRTGDSSYIEIWKEDIKKIRIQLDKSAGVVGAGEYLSSDPSPETAPYSHPLFPTFSLLPPASSPNFLPTSPETHPTFIAHLEPPIIITKATGRRIMEVVNGKIQEENGGGKGWSGEVGEARMQGEGSGEITWFEDLLVSKTLPTVTTRFSATDSYEVVRLTSLMNFLRELQSD
ncbi:hypothetical protein P7C70_g7613, partial [Phenoliferia sp. Uapishka_3]